MKGEWIEYQNSRKISFKTELILVGENRLVSFYPKRHESFGINIKIEGFSLYLWPPRLKTQSKPLM